MSSTWDSKSLKAVPLTADEILIIDTADSRNQKRATIGSFPFNTTTTSNVGTGEGLALAKVGNDFPFKSLIGTSPIVLTGNANDVTFILNALTNSDLATGVFSNITGIGVQTQALDMGNNLINNVLDPVSAQDAVTKNYVDTTFHPIAATLDLQGNIIINVGGSSNTTNAINLPNDTAIGFAKNGSNITIKASTDDLLEISDNTRILKSVPKFELRHENIPNTNFPFGNIEAFAKRDTDVFVNYANIAFQAEDTDTIEGSITFNLATSGSQSDVLSINQDKERSLKLLNNFDLDINGNNIENVGGTSGETVDAINIANNKSIGWENAAGTKNHIIKLDAFDDFVIDNNRLELLSSDELREILLVSQAMVADGTTISRIVGKAFNSVASLEEYGSIEFVVEDDNSFTEDGSVLLRASENSNLQTYIKLNDSSNNKISALRPVRIEDSSFATLELYKSIIPPLNTTIGIIESRAQNDASSEIVYSTIVTEAEKVIAGDESASIRLSVIRNGTPIDYFDINGDNGGRIKVGADIDLDANELINVGVLSSVATDAINIGHTGAIGFEEAIPGLNRRFFLNTGDDFEVDSRRFVISERDGLTSQLFIKLDTIPSAGDEIGNITSRSLNAASTEKSFAQIRFFSEDTTVDDGEGSMDIRIVQNDVATQFIEINKSKDNEIKFFKDLDMGNQKVLNIGDTSQTTEAINLGKDQKIGFNDQNQLESFTIGLNTDDELESNAVNLRLNVNNPAINNTRIILDRDTILSPNLVIGSLDGRTQNSIGVTNTYGRLSISERTNIDGTENGTVQIGMLEDGTFTQYIEFNKTIANQVQINRELGMNGTNKIVDLKDPTENQDATTKIYNDIDRSPNYVYVKTADDIGPLLSLSNITAFNDIGGGSISCLSLAHGLLEGNVVRFTGGTPYDGTDYEITVTDDDFFIFTETFTSTGTGTWTAKKRQAYKVKPFDTVVYILLDNVTFDAPILLTPPSSTPVTYRILSDLVDTANLIFDYDTTLGAAFQGESLFSMYRYALVTIMSAALQTANVRTVDVGFTSLTREFYVDEALTDLGAGVYIRGAQRVTFKNSPFFLTKNLGHLFENCQVVNLNNAIIQPDSGLTTAAIEIKETIRPVDAIITALSMASLTTGKNAFDLDLTDADSRVTVTNCIVPVDANLFDATGLDETDIKVLATGNIGHADSMIEAEADFLDITGTLVIINTISVAEKIGVTTWTSINTQRATISTAGVMTYDGLSDKDILVNFSASVERVTGTPINGIGVGLFKNGALISGFAYARSFNAGIVQLNGTRTVNMITGDTMELVVINFDNAVDINVYQANVVWNQTA